MRAPRCTIDSSCVIALDHLELVPQLSLLFSEVLVPKAVRKDLFKRRATKDRLRGIFENYAFFQRCDGYEQGAIDFLLAERARKGGKDRGETEAVVQASQFGTAVIVDDPWGRELAERNDLEFHGTFWVLQRFNSLGLLSAADARGCLASLKARKIRFPWKTVNGWLREMGQDPL